MAGTAPTGGIIAVDAMGSDLGPSWGPGEQRSSKMVFIGIELPKDILLQGLAQCLV